MDPDVIDKLPLKSRASLKEIIYLVIVVFALMGFGSIATSKVQGYLAAQHQETLAAIAAATTVQQIKLDALAGQQSDHEKRIMENTRLVEVIRRYGWTNAAMRRWASQLDKLNRSAVPALIVPEVPDVPDLREAAVTTR